MFYPQVPVIVCSKFMDQIAAMPANSCMSISNKPAMVALAIYTTSRTASVVRRSRKFSINWINYVDRDARRALLDLSKSLADKNVKDKLSANGVPYSLQLRIPVIASAEAFALCNLKRTLLTGDHYLFVGHITAAYASPDFEEYWKFSKYSPPLYLGSNRSRPLRTF